MRAFLLILLICVTAPAMAQERYIDGPSGRSVAATIEGVEWDEIDTRYLPGGLTVVFHRVAGRDAEGAYWLEDFEVLFRNGARVTGSTGAHGAIIGTCFDSSGAQVAMGFASFCHSWPEFRDAVIVLIAMGSEYVEFSGEFGDWDVDLHQLDISRADIIAWTTAAGALNPANQDN
jgi:hypothetical protein